MKQVCSEVLEMAQEMIDDGTGKGEVLDFIMDNVFDDEEDEDD